MYGMPSYLFSIVQEFTSLLIQALDVWMAGCMMFVFAALGEFVVVKVLDLQHAKNDSQSSTGSCSVRNYTSDNFINCISSLLNIYYLFLAINDV